jgi:WD40 repeat protein
MSQFLIQTTIDTRERPASLLATSTFLDHALTASVDRTVRYINPLTYEEEYCGQGHSRGITALAISDCIQAQAPIICSSARDGVLCLWGPRKAEVIRKVTPPCPEIKTLSIFQYATVCYIILGTKDGKVIIYDMATNSVLKTLLGHRSSVLCSSVVYRGKHLDGEPLVTRHIAIATGGKDRTVRVWDFDKGKRKRKLKHPKLVTCLAVARESIKPVLISGCSNGLLYLWDISMGIVLRTFEGHQEKIYRYV